MTDETVQAVEPAAEPVVSPEIETQAPIVQETPDDAGPESDDKPRGGFQRRIKELSDDRNYWRDMAMRHQPQTPTPPPTPAPDATPTPAKRPKLEDYGYDEAKYEAALDDYVTARAKAAAQEELRQAEQARTHRERVTTFAERQAAFAKDKPDYAQKVQDPTLPITDAMRDVILDSPDGPEVAYWLAQNRDIAARIAQMPPHLAALELGRIEGRIEAKREAKTAPPPVTKAPPPPPQVEAAEPDVDKDPDQMSVPEWKKWRAKGLQQKKA